MTSDDVALRTATQYAHSKGALVVASAGNVEQTQSGSQDTAVRFPAGYPEALAVTAVDAQGNPSQSVVHGTHVEIAAPGSQIASTFFANGDCMFATQGASTSYATGYVGAIVALIAARYPNETPISGSIAFWRPHFVQPLPSALPKRAGESLRPSMH